MYSDVAMPITVETATSAANDANKRLTSSLVIGNSKGKTFTLPADEIAKWIQVKPDIQKGTITLAYDQDAIRHTCRRTSPRNSTRTWSSRRTSPTPTVPC